jgi:hypothetical protein
MWHPNLFCQLSTRQGVVVSLLSWWFLCLESFSVPTSQLGFKENVLASWSDRGDEAPGLPFENCLAKIKVVGVAYDLN